MTTYTVTYNERKSAYEVHGVGCQHLNLGYQQVMVTKESPLSPRDFMAEYSEANEKCWTMLAPCAKRAAKEAMI